MAGSTAGTVPGYLHTLLVPFASAGSCDRPAPRYRTNGTPYREGYCLVPDVGFVDMCFCQRLIPRPFVLYDGNHGGASHGIHHGGQHDGGDVRMIHQRDMSLKKSILSSSIPPRDSVSLKRSIPASWVPQMDVTGVKRSVLASWVPQMDDTCLKWTIPFSRIHPRDGASFNRSVLALSIPPRDGANLERSCLA
ncbi:unnamed protein product [Cuscuta campestris]|uniref:Uncharacterized protein n=1 Tax=Cuscuta campestris TaxID=132261 RepID=A0A484L2Z9_9ASTE|nr:unnamed protein product [Cuscuta campestris]